MTFHTQWDPAEAVLEEHPDSMTETAGYIPTEALIHSFEEAGLRLEIARDFEFPNADDVPEDYDPVRFSSRLDALAVAGPVKERLMAFVEEQKKAAKAKAAAAVVEPAKPVVDPNVPS